MKIKDRINFLTDLIKEKHNYLNELDEINMQNSGSSSSLGMNGIENEMKEIKEEIKKYREKIIENIDDIDTAERDLSVFKNTSSQASKQPESFYNESVIPFGNQYFYTQLTVIDNKVNKYFSPIYSYICVDVALNSYILQYEVGLETLLGVLCSNNEDAYKLRLYCRNNSTKNISIFCFTKNTDNTVNTDNTDEIDITDLKQFGVVSPFVNV